MPGCSLSAAENFLQPPRPASYPIFGDILVPRPVDWVAGLPRRCAAAAFFHSDRSQLHSTLKHWHWRDERSRARRPSHAPSMPPALAMRGPTTVGSKAVELGSTQLVWHSNVVLSVFINSRYDRRRHGIACLACRSGSLVREPSWSCAAARRDGQLRRVPRATLLAASSG
jgi:hypothetical protein